MEKLRSICIPGSRSFRIVVGIIEGTHVMVDDPTSGYGIYVGRMLRLDGAA